MGYLRRLVSASRAAIGGAVRSVAEREFLPAERRDDDLFLVEFPKSGITWLTFLVANVNAQLGDDRHDVTFFNVNDFVPDIQSARHIGPSPRQLPGYRWFKSHARYIRDYRKVVYLVRDPRHVMVSYWTFLTGLGSWHGTLDELVSHREYGIAAWVDHVAGWLDGIDAAASFVLLRYEDLMSDTSGELTRLYRLLGLPATGEMIARAIERSSIERMRQLEAEFSAGHPALKGLQFVRRGPPGGAREPLPSRVRVHIEREAGPIMERLGYHRCDSAAESLASSPTTS